jgi:hypothetical protein
MTGEVDPKISGSLEAWTERAEEDYLLALSAMRQKSPLT